MKQLSDQEFLFVDEYVRTGDKVKSHQLAYKETSRRFSLIKANEILKRPHVREAVEEMRVELRSVAKVTREQLALRFKDLADAAQKDEKWTAANSALNNLAKLLGFYEQKISIQHDYSAGQLVEQIESMLSAHPELEAALPAGMRKKVYGEPLELPAETELVEVGEDPIDF